MGGVKVIKPDEFRQMQLLELGMLKEFDRVCRENQIQYTIFGGTLLGAVRHQGYIPWDDDADIAMLRQDYEKFKKIASQMDQDICYFQDHTTDPEYRWGYGKLRRTGTKYVRIGQEHLKCKTGVFVDVFPMDDIPLSTIGKVINDFYCFCLRKILWAEVGRLDVSESKFTRMWYGLLAKIPSGFVFKRLDALAAKSRNDSPNQVRTLLFPATGKLYKKNPVKLRYGMPKKWFTDLAEYEFEGVRLYGTRDYNTNLTYIYGDYMKLPPVGERKQHSPVSDYDFGEKA